MSETRKQIIGSFQMTTMSRLLALASDNADDATSIARYLVETLEATFCTKPEQTENTADKVNTDLTDSSSPRGDITAPPLGATKPGSGASVHINGQAAQDAEQAPANDPVPIGNDNVLDQFKLRLTGMKQREKSQARKLEALRILSSEKSAISLDDMMTRLKRVGLAIDKDRGSVVTMLSRMRVDTNLVESPFDGAYKITDSGLAYHKKNSQLCEDLTVPMQLR